MTTGIRRDGHLTDLAIDQVVMNQATFEHLATCALCQQRVEHARHFAATEVLPALAVASPAHSTRPVPANRSWFGWVGWGVAVAAVGLLAFTVSQEDTTTDGIRTKGSGVTLQLFRDEGPGGERLHNGAEVAPGDRIGFRVRHREEGHLMVLGVDARDDAYLCYPQSRDGQPDPADVRETAETLPEAVQLDPTPGTERMVAVVCEQAYPFEVMSAFVREHQVPLDCAMDEVELRKP